MKKDTGYGIRDTGAGRRVPDSIFVGMQEAAELLGVSRQTVWRMVKEGRLVKVPVKRGMMALRREDVLGVGNKEITERNGGVK